MSWEFTYKDLKVINGWLGSIEELQSAFNETPELAGMETATEQMIPPYKEAAKELHLYLKRRDVRIKDELKEWLDKVMTRIEGFLKKEYDSLSSSFTRTMDFVRGKEGYNIRTFIEEAIAYTKTEEKQPWSPKEPQHAKFPRSLRNIKRIIECFESKDLPSLTAVRAEWMRCVALRRNVYNQERVELPFTEDMKYISAIHATAVEWSPAVIDRLTQIAHYENNAQYWVKEAQCVYWGQESHNKDWLQAHSAARKGFALCTQPPSGEPFVIYSYLILALRMIQLQAVEQYDVKRYQDMAIHCDDMEGKQYRRLEKAIKDARENIGKIRDVMLTPDQTARSIPSLRILASRVVFLKINGYLPLQQLNRGRLVGALETYEQNFKVIQARLHHKLPDFERPKPFEDVDQEDIEACVVKFNPLLERKITQYKKDRLLLGPVDGVSLNQIPVFVCIMDGIKSFDTCAQAIKALPPTQTEQMTLLTTIRDATSKFSSNNHALLMQFLDRPFFDEKSKTTLTQCWEMVAETTKQQLVQIKSLLLPAALKQIQSIYKKYNELSLQVNVAGRDELVQALEALVNNQDPNQEVQLLQQVQASIAVFTPIYDEFIRRMNEIIGLIVEIQQQQTFICDILESEIKVGENDPIILEFPDELLKDQQYCVPIAKQQHEALEQVRLDLDPDFLSKIQTWGRLEAWTAGELTEKQIKRARENLTNDIEVLKEIDSFKIQPLE